MSAKPLYTGRLSVAGLVLNNVADGAIADSNEFDNTTDLATTRIIEVNATGSNVSEAGKVIVYAREGLITGDLETDENLTRIGSVTLNGTTAVQKVLRYENPAPFYQLSFKQQSSGAFALGASGNDAFSRQENIQDI